MSIFKPLLIPFYFASGLIFMLMEGIIGVVTIAATGAWYCASNEKFMWQIPPEEFERYLEEKELL